SEMRTSITLEPQATNDTSSTTLSSTSGSDDVKSLKSPSESTATDGVAYFVDNFKDYQYKGTKRGKKSDDKSKATDTTPSVLSKFAVIESPSKTVQSPTRSTSASSKKVTAGHTSSKSTAVTNQQYNSASRGYGYYNTSKPNSNYSSAFPDFHNTPPPCKHNQYFKGQKLCLGKDAEDF
ncbi:hypothetical protein BGZ49_006598, partial [Haplosporangium sp. Z 27]